MTSHPAELFTPEERAVLEHYRNPKASDLRRLTRLSVQYLLSAGLFTFLAIAYNPWFSVVVWVEFAAFVAIRLLGARRIAGVMPGILAAYEAKLAEREGGPTDPTPPAEP